MRASAQIDVACAACGAPLTVLTLGTAPPLCANCGRHASHAKTNGLPDEAPSSDAENPTFESSPLPAPR